MPIGSSTVSPLDQLDDVERDRKGHAHVDQLSVRLRARMLESEMLAESMVRPLPSLSVVACVGPSVAACVDPPPRIIRTLPPLPSLEPEFEQLERKDRRRRQRAHRYCRTVCPCVS